jgi:hypothetical protein
MRPEGRLNVGQGRREEGGAGYERPGEGNAH